MAALLRHENSGQVFIRVGVARISLTRNDR
jgi:hypothetical protein